MQMIAVPYGKINDANFKLRNFFAVFIPGVKSTAEIEREKESKRREEELRLQREQAERDRAKWEMEQQLLLQQQRYQQSNSPLSGIFPQSNSLTMWLVLAGVAVAVWYFLFKKK